MGFRKLELIAVFLIGLVLTMPFIQSVSAASVNIDRISGNDELEGYARSNGDRITIEATAQVPGDSVQNDQLKVFVDGSEQRIFNSCIPSPTPGYFQCTYQEDVPSLSNEEYEYEVKLFSDTAKLTPGAAPLTSASATLKTDTMPPRIKAFSIQPKVSGGEEVAITYDVADYAHSIGDSKCSGLKSLRLYIADTGEEIDVIPLEGCSISSFYPYMPTQAEGAIDICAVATDILGQESEPSCDYVSVDDLGPSIDSFIFVDDDWQEITHSTGREEYLVKLIANITDEEIDPNEVFADLSGLTAFPGFEKIPWTNQFGGTTKTFVWENVPIDQYPCGFSIMASDTVGNTVNQAYDCGIEIDNEGPVLQELRSNYANFFDEPLVGPKNSELIVTFKETGVGFKKKQVYLDLSRITGEIEAQADECNKITDEFWECTWIIDPTAPDGNYTVYVSEFSKDDLGNRLDEGDEFPVSVDRTSPIITDIVQELDPVTSEDELYFEFRVENTESVPTVLINASEISPIKTPIVATCQREKEIVNWTCEGLVPELNKEYSPGVVKFMASDEVGNKFKSYVFITVYEADVLTTPDFFEVEKVNVIPSKMDIKVAQTIATTFFAKPKLKMRSDTDKAKILAQAVNCTQLQKLSEIPYVVNEPSMTPMIPIRLAQGVVNNLTKDDTVELSCSLELSVRKGGRVYRIPEKEKFKAEVGFYGNRLGEIEENAQEKIDQVNRRLDKFEDRLHDWDKANDILGGIASVATMAGQVHGIIAAMVFPLWIISVILEAIGLTKKIGEGIWMGTVIAEKAITTIVNLLFWNTGPISTLSGIFGTTGVGLLPGLYTAAVMEGIAGIMKVITVIYTCQLCDYDDMLGLIVNGFESGATYEHNDMKGKPTSLESFTVYKWDPYKSIHVSAGCLCIPGIVYNMRKERQIRCIYRNCLIDHAKRGLPFDTCDIQNKELNCLYVDGAAWTVAGSGLTIYFQLLLSYIINNLPSLVYGIIFTLLCHTGLWQGGTQFRGQGVGVRGTIYAKANQLTHADTEKLIESSHNIESGALALCSILTAPLELVETHAFTDNEFDWDAFTRDLEGIDYCSTTEYQLPMPEDNTTFLSDNLTEELGDMGILGTGELNLSAELAALGNRTGPLNSTEGGNAS